jgi:hypothetical protein
MQEKDDGLFASKTKLISRQWSGAEIKHAAAAISIMGALQSGG